MGTEISRNMFASDDRVIVLSPNANDHRIVKLKTQRPIPLVEASANEYGQEFGFQKVGKMDGEAVLVFSQSLEKSEILELVDLLAIRVPAVEAVSLILAWMAGVEPSEVKAEDHVFGPTLNMDDIMFQDSIYRIDEEFGTNLWGKNWVKTPNRDLVNYDLRLTVCGLADLVRPTFETVADIIAEMHEIPRDEITPESHTDDDLGIDSLDFLDIIFAVNKEFGIKIPMEAWTEDINGGYESTERYFVLKNFCQRIDELVAAKK